MKKSFNKGRITSIIALILVCVLSLSLFSCGSDKGTGENNNDDKKDSVPASIKAIMDGDYQKTDIPENAPDTVIDMYQVTKNKELQGNVVIVEVMGYHDKMTIGIGIDKNSRTTNVVILNEHESHGRDLSSMIEVLSLGKEADDIANVDVVSGATVSSTAIKRAVADAFKTVSGIASDPDPDPDPEPDPEPEPEELPTSEEQILTYAKEMVGEGATFTDVTPNERNLVRRIYRENSGKGYIAYLVVMSRYGTIETETIIHVKNDGKISNIKKLIWKTSDAMYGYVPPEADVIDAFYASLVGKNVEDLQKLATMEDNTDSLLVTGATSTSKNLVSALIEGLEAINALCQN